MSTIGQYIHWSWGNYAANGTFKNTVFWRGNKAGNTGPTNFSQTLFIQHRQNIRARAKAQFAFTGNLKQLETEYNKTNQDMSKYLQSLLQTLKQNNGAVSEKAVLKSLLQLINKSWTDIQIEDILKNLYVDKNGLFKYKGAGLSVTGVTGKKVFIPKGKTIYIQRTLARCKDLRLQFNKLIAEGLLDANTIDFQTIITNIETALVLMAEKQKINKTIIKSGISNLDDRKVNAHGALPVSNKTVEQYIINPLNELYAVFSSRESINKILTYRLGEILGELAAAKANEIGLNALQKELNSWLKSGTSGSQMTTKITNSPDFFWGFNKKALDGVAKQEIKIKTDIGEDIVDYKFREVGSDVQQKTDVVFQGQHISLKTTSLHNIEYQKSFLDIPGISLQDSSLFLYLMGIQSQDANYGTHYLNILSKHPDAGVVYETMRKQANRSLELYILYSALTGEGQLRQGKMANVFAVYETQSKTTKEEPRVKFFSTWDIINKIDQAQGEGLILTPKISSLSFDNTWIGHPGAASIDNANLRISRILVEARNTQIAASISKSFLNKIYK